VSSVASKKNTTPWIAKLKDSAESVSWYEEEAQFLFEFIGEW
jgi:hypothetical protein